MDRQGVQKLLAGLFAFALPLGTRVALFQVGSPAVPYTTLYLYATDLAAIALVALAGRHPWQAIRQRPLISASLGVFFAIGIVSASISDLPLLGFITLARLAVFSLAALALSEIITSIRASYFLMPLLAGAILQAILACWQFFAQRSAGFMYLGEQTLGVAVTGVAKLDIAGEKIIRAYGTLPHPNVLGAFLVMALLAAIAMYSMPGGKMRGGMLLTAIALMLAGLFFTFSRSAWLAFGIAIAILIAYAAINVRRLPEAAFRRLATLGVLFAACWFAAAALFSPYMLSRASLPALHDQAVQIRLNGFYWAARMIDANKLFGVGPGQFVTQITQTGVNLTESWMYQPVHSAYALVAAEYGLAGALAFFVFIGSALWAWRKSRLKSENPLLHAAAFCIVAAFLVLGLFDHYFLTFEQGIGLFWVSVAFMLAA
ncbi:MAG: O-antigen ligase family protein [bacterium]|nr:O-antigen ligase family protein [bacterium]